MQTGIAESLQGEKAALRGRILKERNVLLPGQRKIWDGQIFGQLVRMDKAFPCPVYLCYVNYRSEVSTKEFILWCLENGKTVFVPKVMERNTADMEFYQITAWEELKAGYQGILEPEALPEKSFSEWIARSGISGQFAGVRRSVTAGREETSEGEKTAGKIRMLLPGAVFDGQGNRIGYGGGFYDRWLAWWDRTVQEKRGMLEKIGLAYHIQMVDCVPAEVFDQKVDCVITDRCEQLMIRS